IRIIRENSTGTWPKGAENRPADAVSLFCLVHCPLNCLYLTGGLFFGLRRGGVQLLDRPFPRALVFLHEVLFLPCREAGPIHPLIQGDDTADILVNFRHPLIGRLLVPDAFQGGGHLLHGGYFGLQKPIGGFGGGTAPAHAAQQEQPDPEANHFAHRPLLSGQSLGDLPPRGADFPAPGWSHYANLVRPGQRKNRIPRVLFQAFRWQRPAPEGKWDGQSCPSGWTDKTVRPTSPPGRPGVWREP